MSERQRPGSSKSLCSHEGAGKSRAIVLTVVSRRIREKYEAELREVERSERKTLEKFNTMKVLDNIIYTKNARH